MAGKLAGIISEVQLSSKHALHTKATSLFHIPRTTSSPMTTPPWLQTVFPWGTILPPPAITYPEGYDPAWQDYGWGIPPPKPFPPVTTPGPYPNPMDPLGPGISGQDRFEMNIPGDEVEVVEGVVVFSKLSPVEPVRPFVHSPFRRMKHYARGRRRYS